MRAAFFPEAAGRARSRLGRRATGLALVIVVHLLLALLLLMLTPKLPPAPTGPKTFTLSPIRAPSLAKKPVVAARHAHAGAPPRKAPSHAVTKPLVAAPKSDRPSTKPFTTELMEAVDIAALPNHKNDTASATDGSGIGPGTVGAGNASGSLYSANGAPGGEPLYNAEWVTEPTRAELTTYLPHNLPDASWGVIVCRTIERNRVDDCQELGDSQPGLGLARGMRQAAWQFHVRPPRVGGKALVGAWVRIRIDEHVEDRSGG
jgi:hypothetical protein